MRSSDRQPKTDFPRPLTDQIREHSGDIDDRQRDRDGGKGQEQQHR